MPFDFLGCARYTDAFNGFITLPEQGMDCDKTLSSSSDSSLLLLDPWRSFLTTWSRLTRLETRTN